MLLPSRADTTAGPKDIVLEGVTYTVTLTTFGPPIQLEAGVPQNRTENLPSWLAAYRKMEDPNAAWQEFRASGTDDYFADGVITAETFAAGNAVLRQREPVKESVCFVVNIKCNRKELAFVNQAPGLLPAMPEEGEFTTTIFRLEAGDVWKFHDPVQEQWFRLFPLGQPSKIKALIDATGYVISQGVIQPAP
jgi:hypothetical protein